MSLEARIHNGSQWGLVMDTNKADPQTHGRHLAGYLQLAARHEQAFDKETCLCRLLELERKN